MARAAPADFDDLTILASQSCTLAKCGDRFFGRADIMAALITTPTLIVSGSQTIERQKINLWGD